MALIQNLGKFLKQSKDKILHLGTPYKEQVLYEEVIKRDKPQERVEKEVVLTEETAKEPVVTPHKKPKKKIAKKSIAKKPLTKKEEKIILYTKDIQKHYGEVDKDLLAHIVKNLGPSIYRKNAELVACSEPKELDTVRRNFLVKKLELTESKVLLEASIQEVCQELKGVRRKYRATFYYRLAQKFNKESFLS
ncbi:MAG: DUF2853 family protein [Sulfurovum sp.]|nr:DUF2853 family protein [Sulfurovum sp.]